MTDVRVFTEDRRRFDGVHGQEDLPAVPGGRQHGQQVHLHDELAVVIDFQDLVVPVQEPGKDRPVNVLHVPVHLPEELVGRAVSDLLAEREERAVPRRERDLDIAAANQRQAVHPGDRHVPRHVPEDPGDFVGMGGEAVLAPTVRIPAQEARNPSQMIPSVKEGERPLDPLPFPLVGGIPAPLGQDLLDLFRKPIRRDGPQRGERDERVGVQMRQDVYRQAVGQTGAVLLDDLPHSPGVVEAVEWRDVDPEILSEVPPPALVELRQELGQALAVPQQIEDGEPHREVERPPGPAVLDVREESEIAGEAPVLVLGGLEVQLHWPFAFDESDHDGIVTLEWRHDSAVRLRRFKPDRTVDSPRAWHSRRPFARGEQVAWRGDSRASGLTEQGQTAE